MTRPVATGRGLARPRVVPEPADRAGQVATELGSRAAAVKRRGNTLSVFKKQDGHWRLCRDANMLTVVPE